MNLETLRYFQYIAKYKNITRAAKHFYISQSTLSRNIMLLEKELGVQLFDRNNKQIELTEAGKVFEHDCELFIKHMQNVTQNVKIANQGDAGILRITTPGRLCNTVSDSINQFRSEFPNINLIVETYDFEEIVSAILYDVYHIGFTYDFASNNTDLLESMVVGTDDFSLAVSSSLFPDASPESIPEIVKLLPLILPSFVEPPFMNIILMELQRISGVKKVNTTYVNNTDSVMLEASLNLGYGIVPTSLTKSKSGSQNITYINLQDFSAKSSIVMLYKPNPSGFLESFINILKKNCCS